MKLFRAFLLALGIAAPLWYRQWQIEKDIAELSEAQLRRTERFEREVSKAFKERDRQDTKWREELLREVKRAFGRGAAR